MVEFGREYVEEFHDLAVAETRRNVGRHCAAKGLEDLVLIKSTQGQGCLFPYQGGACPGRGRARRASAPSGRGAAGPDPRARECRIGAKGGETWGVPHHAPGLRVEFEPWLGPHCPGEVLFGVHGKTCKQPFGLPVPLRLVPA